MASIGYGETERIAEAQVELAGWWSRVGAALIDGLILVIPLVVVAIIGAVIGSSGLIAVGYVLLFLASLVYAPYLMAREGSDNGQTFGKSALGIRVVREDGQPMDFGKGVIRDFVGKTILGIIPFYSFVDVLFPLFDGRNQALHDKLGSTTVRRA
jgi:uncharacterized RDD family membrane protein YckC